MEFHCITQGLLSESPLFIVSLINPDLRAVLFRRWSFGVLLWEIETGGELFYLARVN